MLESIKTEVLTAEMELLPQVSCGLPRRRCGRKDKPLYFPRSGKSQVSHPRAPSKGFVSSPKHKGEPDRVVCLLTRISTGTKCPRDQLRVRHPPMDGGRAATVRCAGLPVNPIHHTPSCLLSNPLFFHAWLNDFIAARQLSLIT